MKIGIILFVLLTACIGITYAMWMIGGDGDD